MIKQNLNEKLSSWVQKYTFQLILLNIILVLLVLLRSAGYFEPYLTISINFIYVISLLLMIFLLNLKAKGAFIISIIFWLLSCFLALVNIDVWAERTGVYTYEAIVAGIFLLITESFYKKKN